MQQAENHKDIVEFNSFIFVKFLQRKRNSRIYTEIHGREDLLHKLAHAIMEVEKSQNLLSANWGTKRASGLINLHYKG